MQQRQEYYPCLEDRKISILDALKACSRTKDVERGKTVHAAATEKGDDKNICVANTLINMYSKCGNMQEARKVFEEMPRHTVVTYNALILGYASNGNGQAALELFSEMEREGFVPSYLTFVAALKACTTLATREGGNILKLDSLKRGAAIHLKVIDNRCEKNIYVACTLVDMYAKCGSIDRAYDVFSRMPYRNVVSWTSLISGYANNGDGLKALDLFSQMEREGCAADSLTYIAALKACTILATSEDGVEVDGKLVKVYALRKGMALHSRALCSGCEMNIYVACTLVDMYAKCGSMIKAHKVFDGMRRRNAVAWTTLILGYADNGEGTVALKVFFQMEREGCTADALTFLAILKACTSAAAKEDWKQIGGKLVKVESLEKGISLHLKAADGGFTSNIYVANTLVDMYAKCGSTTRAREVFNQMKHRDVVSWNSLISGYADNGEGNLALETFSQMGAQGITPNASSFVVGLKACSMIGALEYGKILHCDIFNRGLQDNILVANSLIDFYGKCSSMVVAQQVFDALGMKDLVAWTSLLAGYSRIGDTHKVFQLFGEMQNEKLRPNNITFLCILTACSHAGLLEKGKEYFDSMTSKYGIRPEIEHYNCMVDMLSRANKLDTAFDLVYHMPVPPNGVTWMAILAACRKWKNVELGRLASEALLSLNEGCK